MPCYNYKCSECETIFEKNVPRKEHKQLQTCECGGEAIQVIGDVNFVLKGDGWVGKNQTIKGQMADKNRRLDAKSRERRHDAPGVRLAPNVGGERVDTWDDAAKLARSKGLEDKGYLEQAKVKK